MNKRLIYMVGLPCSGKTTFIEKNFPKDTCVISFDHIVEDVAKKQNKTYDEVFDFVSMNKRKLECYLKILCAVDSNEPIIIIDNCNLTIKNRALYDEVLNKGYKKEAIVFSFSKNKQQIYKERNKIRSKGQGKTIPENIFDFMVNIYQPIIADNENFTRVIMYD